MKSKSIAIKDGERIVFEEGPRSLRPAGLPGLNVLDLIQQLGIRDQMILVPKTSSSAKNRYIYYQGKVHRLPSSLVGFIRFALSNPILKGSLFSLLMEPFRRRRPASLADETIGSFISRRFSPILAQNMLSAVVHGIYSGSIHELSIKSTFNVLWQYEGRYGSVIRGLFASPNLLSEEDRKLQESLEQANPGLVEEMKGVSVYSFQGGLGTLAKALEADLERSPNVEIRRDSRIERCDVSTDSATIVSTKDGQTDEHKFDRVVSSLSARHLSSLISSGNHAAIKNELEAIRYSTVMVINLYYTNPDLLPIDGFGYLIPISVPIAENPDRALGVVFDSSSVPGQDSASGTKVTCIMGGHFWSERKDDELPSQEEAVEATKRVMKMHLGITEEPAAWNAVLQKDCIPQYTVGHAERMTRLHSLLDRPTDDVLEEKANTGEKAPKKETGKDLRLSLVGSSYGGVSVNDCILNARKLAMRLSNSDRGTGLDGFRDNN